MKHRIAGFLGELAEELGWTPEFEHARIKPERTRPPEKATASRPAVLTPDDDSPALRASPVALLQAEVKQLHSTGRHLGSEVISLRAQMAKLRSLPIPPDADTEDADRNDATADSTQHTLDRFSPSDAGQDESTATRASVRVREPEARPWPPRLIPVPPVEPASSSASTPKDGDNEAMGDAAAVADVIPQLPAAAPDLETAVQPQPAAVVEAAAMSPAHDGHDAHEVVEPVSPSAEAVPDAPGTRSPTIIEIGDSPESGLELFPSEPGPSASLSAEADARESTKSASGKRKRRRRKWTGARF